METIRLLYPDWLVIGTFGFLVLFAIIICCFIFVSIKIVEYINVTLYPDTPTTLYIKDLDGDNIINLNEIERVTQGYNRKEEQYEIIYHLKSGLELKEIFDGNNPNGCIRRFNDIYNILND